MDGVVIDKTKGEEIQITGTPSMAENANQETEPTVEQEPEIEEVIEEEEPEGEEPPEGEDNAGTGPQNQLPTQSSEKVDSSEVASLKQTIITLEQRNADKDKYIQSLKVRVEAQDAIVRETQEALGAFDEFFSKESKEELVGAFNVQTYFDLKNVYVENKQKISELGIKSKLRTVGAHLDLTQDEVKALNAEMAKEWGSKANTVIANTPVDVLHSWFKGRLQEIRANPSKIVSTNQPNSQEDLKSFEQRIENTVTQILERVLPSVSKAEPVKKAKGTAPAVVRKTAPIVKNKSGEVMRFTGSVAI